MGDKKENLILSVSSENEAKIVVNKSIFIGIIRKVENREEVVKFIEELQKNYTKKIAVEVEAVNNYIDAEEYHQKYLEKNPTGYCHVDLSLAKKSLWIVK